MTENDLCTIYIARHGETEWNVKHRIQGQTDSPLTSAGIEQAKNLAKELKDIKFDAAFSSDLLRAKRTARFVAIEHKLIIQTKKALRERNFGDYEGKSSKLLDLLEESADKTNKYETLNIESDENFASRFLTLLREIAIAYPGKKILVVTHGGVMMMLLAHLGYTNLAPRPIGNTAYIKLESDGVDFFVKAMKGVKLENDAS